MDEDNSKVKLDKRWSPFRSEGKDIGTNMNRKELKFD